MQDAQSQSLAVTWTEGRLLSCSSEGGPGHPDGHAPPSSLSEATIFRSCFVLERVHLTLLEIQEGSLSLE